MKKLSLLLSSVLVVTTLFTGCSHGKSQGTVAQDTTTKTGNVDFAQKLSDAAVATYLGKSADADYSKALSGVTPLANDTGLIQLSKEANQTFLGMLSAATTLPTSMPESKYYMKPAPGDEKKTTVDPNNPVEKLKAAIYPNGTVPDMALVTDAGDPTPEFTNWFVKQAQNTGLLDKRVQLGDKNSLCVMASDCAQSKGGNTFNVFGTQCTVDAITKEDTQTSPIYTMKLKSYSYFDTGIYRAVYETDPSSNAPKTVQIEVTFTHKDVTGNDKSDVAKYLAGVSDLSVRLK